MLILSTRLRLGLPSGLFPSGFPIDIYIGRFITIYIWEPLHKTALPPRSNSRHAGVVSV
jgi:hypothetical protein